MGGKGRRRREKNFLAAHGGDSRLPPPPQSDDFGTLPSKLRKLIQFRSNNKNDNNDESNNQGYLQKNPMNKKRKRDDADEKANPKDVRPSVEFDLGKEDVSLEKESDKSVTLKKESVKNVEGKNTSDTRKKKRKRKMVDDLRFLDQAAGPSKNKERKREYYELKKKKKKQRKGKKGDIHEFPGREKVKFGEIVQAPPKLSLPQKVPKISASEERMRSQAVETYRKHRGWTSKLGVRFPVLEGTPSALLAKK